MEKIMLRFKLIPIMKKPLLKVVLHREKLTNTYTAKITYATTHIAKTQKNFRIKNLKNISKI